MSVKTKLNSIVNNLHTLLQNKFSSIELVKGFKKDISTLPFERIYIALISLDAKPLTVEQVMAYTVRIDLVYAYGINDASDSALETAQLHVWDVVGDILDLIHDNPTLNDACRWCHATTVSFEPKFSEDIRTFASIITLEAEFDIE